MIAISQSEAAYLREKNRGEDIHVSSKSHKSHGKRYWLTESAKSVKLLNDYRRKNVIETHGGR